MKSIAAPLGCVQKDSGPCRVVDLRLVGDETVLLRQVACKLGELITLTVTMKDRAGDKAKKRKAECGSIADSVLHADLHRAARD